MITEEKKLWAVEQLLEKSRQLGRLPKRTDFDDVRRSRIKAFLGPWPRALEAAGLKEAKPVKKSKKRRKPKTGKAKTVSASPAGSAAHPEAAGADSQSVK